MIFALMIIKYFYGLVSKYSKNKFIDLGEIIIKSL